MAKQIGIPRQWQEKICPRCGVELTEDNHIPSSVKHSDYKCKDCDKKYKEKIKEDQRRYRQRPEVKEKRKEYISKYRVENMEKIIENRREYRERNRERISARLRERRERAINILGSECVYCGCDEFDALEFNHINGITGKRLTPQQLVGRILKGEANLSELEVACTICNAWHYITKLKGIPDGWTITWEDRK